MSKTISESELLAIAISESLNDEMRDAKFNEEMAMALSKSVASSRRVSSVRHVSSSRHVSSARNESVARREALSKHESVARREALSKHESVALGNSAARRETARREAVASGNSAARHDSAAQRVESKFNQDTARALELSKVDKNSGANKCLVTSVSKATGIEFGAIQRILATHGTEAIKKCLMDGSVVDIHGFAILAWHLCITFEIYFKLSATERFVVARYGTAGPTHRIRLEVSGVSSKQLKGKWVYNTNHFEYDPVIPRTLVATCPLWAKPVLEYARGIAFDCKCVQSCSCNWSGTEHMFM